MGVCLVAIRSRQKGVVDVGALLGVSRGYGTASNAERECSLAFCLSPSPEPTSRASTLAFISANSAQESPSCHNPSCVEPLFPRITAVSVPNPLLRDIFGPVGVTRTPRWRKWRARLRYRISYWTMAKGPRPAKFGADRLHNAVINVGWQMGQGRGFYKAWLGLLEMARPRQVLEEAGENRHRKKG